MKDKTAHYIDVYSIVTNRIIEHLEKGVVPWQKTWTEAGLPKNLITGKHFRGINVWLLTSLNYSQNCFLTFKQIKWLGGSVKKGEKSQEVIFWKWIERENEETGENEITLFLRYYRVFNISQCDGIPNEKIPRQIERENNPIETCEKIINEMPKCPQIIHKEQRAYYSKSRDYINMPKMETFTNSENYYETLFYELVHSTGHDERLNRKELSKNNSFGTEDYAIEELTAEMGASYLKSHAGIPIVQLENNAAYIQSWLTRLRNDKKFIVYASSQAQKATDYILNIKSDHKELGMKKGIEDKDKQEAEKILAEETICNEKGRYNELRNSRQQREIKSAEINIDI